MGEHADYLYYEGLEQQWEDPEGYDEDYVKHLLRGPRNKMSDLGIIKLKMVRLSFPALWEAKSFNDGKPSFKAVLLLDKKKDAGQIAMINKTIEAVKKEKWPKGVKNLKGLCLRDGSEKEDVDGYGDDVMFISSSNAKRVPVVDGNHTPLTEEDGKPYAGCYVNVSLRLWAQDNEWGKRVNAQLRAVQFAKDGEPFGEKPVDPEKEFDKEEGSDDSDIM